MITIDKLIEQEVYQKINTSLNLTKIDLIDGKLYLQGCDFKWIGLSNLVIINEKELKVVKSDREEYDYMILNYEGVVPTVVNLKNFYLYEGTPMDVTQVFSQKSNRTRDKLPMMWLSFSPLPILRGSNDPLNPYPYSVSFTLYFAGLTDYGNRHTKQHMREVVSHLSEYVDAVLEAIKVNGVFDELSWTQRPLPIFGRLDANGFVSNILDDTNMSAIELDIDVNMSIKCKC